MPSQLDHYRLLGRSGLRVSPLTLGTMTFGVAANEWGTSDAEAEQMVDLYLGRGGNFIDTANFYGAMGRSELLLGKILAKRREQVIISTKYSLTTKPGDPNASGNHRRNMVRSVEDSLQRLGTDYIDLLYLHMWDFRTPIEEVLRAFDDLVRAGKILYTGLSDTPAWQAARMQATAELRGWTPFCALQISYSLIERTVERELIPMAREMGMGVLPWSPLGGGVLSGKYTAQDFVGEKPEIGVKPGNQLSRKQINVATGRLNAHNLAIAALVGEVAHETGRSSAQIALAWTMTDRAITSPVIGARTLAQLDDNLGALEVDLRPDQLARLNAASAIAMGFPHDMLNSPGNAMAFGNVNVELRDAS